MLLHVWAFHDALPFETLSNNTQQMPCAAHAHAGEMDDAAEVLGAVYDALAQGVPGGGALVIACFGLRIEEGVVCGACNNKISHESDYLDFFHHVSAAALRSVVRRPARVRIKTQNWYRNQITNQNFGNQNPHCPDLVSQGPSCRSLGTCAQRTGFQSCISAQGG